MPAAHPDPWDVLVGRLGSLQLVVPSKDGRLAKMHRVVRAVVLGRMTAEEQEARCGKLEALSLERGKHLKTQWWKVESRWEIEPLHQFCWHQFDRDRTQGATLANWVGASLHLLGKLSDTRRLYRRAVEIGEKHFGPDHPDLAGRYSGLGIVERNLGNLAEAARLCQRAIEIGEKHFDPDHPDLALVYWNLAMITQRAGNLSEAIILVHRSYHAWCNKLGTNHRDVVEAHDWLARNDPNFDPDA